MIDAVVLDFRFFSPLGNGGAKCIAVRPEHGRNLGFCPSFILGGTLEEAV